MNARATPVVRNAVPTPVPSGRMKLDRVSSSRSVGAWRILAYGTEGVGKSTLGAEAPGPVFIAPRKAIELIDAQAFPEPQTFGEVLDAIGELTAEESGYKTLVLDELGWLEHLIFDRVCSDAKVKAIVDIDYGGGYKAALDYWRGLLARLQFLQEKRGMNVLFLGHAEVKRHDDPTQATSFDRYRLALNDKAGQLLRSWVQAFLFARYDLTTVEVKKRVNAHSNGARYLHTQWSPAFDAKNRFGLPDRVALSWADLEAAMASGSPSDPEALLAEIERLRPQLAPAGQLVLTSWLGKAAGDALKLARILDSLTAQLTTKTDTQTQSTEGES